jgi:hypothetical protein
MQVIQISFAIPVLANQIAFYSMKSLVCSDQEVDVPLAKNNL